MIIEGVTFIEPAVKQMSKEEFIEAHKDAFWKDRKPSEREKLLSDAYDAITGKRESKKAKK